MAFTPLVAANLFFLGDDLTLVIAGGILSSIIAQETSPTTTYVVLSDINSIQDDVPSN